MCARNGLLNRVPAFDYLVVRPATAEAAAAPKVTILSATNMWHIAFRSHSRVAGDGAIKLSWNGQIPLNQFTEPIARAFQYSDPAPGTMQLTPGHVPLLTNQTFKVDLRRLPSNVTGDGLLDVANAFALKKTYLDARADVNALCSPGLRECIANTDCAAQLRALRSA